MGVFQRANAESMFVGKNSRRVVDSKAFCCAKCQVGFPSDKEKANSTFSVDLEMRFPGCNTESALSVEEEKPTRL